MTNENKTFPTFLKGKHNWLAKELTGDVVNNLGKYPIVYIMVFLVSISDIFANDNLPYDKIVTCINYDNTICLPHDPEHDPRDVQKMLDIQLQIDIDNEIDKELYL